MRTAPLAALTALTVTAGTLLGAPAQAADPDTLYVQNDSPACSDAGPGTLEQPFCTIGRAAAVATAGQTVRIGGTTYDERVTVANSGTPEEPITFFGLDSARLSGPTAGFVIDGQHDIVLQNLRVYQVTTAPAIELRNASAITVKQVWLRMASAATAPAVRLVGATRSHLDDLDVIGGAVAAGLAMDAATRDVLVSSATLEGQVSTTAAEPGAGIQVEGPGNRIVDNWVRGFTGPAITVGPGAADVVVANNEITGGAGLGIHVRGATGTAVTNNTVGGRCGEGIRVDGAASGVSVQNNVLTRNGRSGTSCYGTPVGGVEIGVYDGAVGDTVVDYNNTYHSDSPSPESYVWGGTPLTLAGFRAASGQAARDQEALYPAGVYDSANSAAPGYPATDRFGQARIDDHGAANTGAGPVTYADRGVRETTRVSVVHSDLKLDLRERAVTVDASASLPGTSPIAYYEFSFGDGTSVVTGVSPIAWHRYAKPGRYAVTIRAIGTDGRGGSQTKYVNVLPWTGSVGLLASHNLRYLGPAPGNTLGANQASLTASAEFDLADAGFGGIALVRRATGKYVSAFESDELLTTTRVDANAPERFTLVRNADGSTSLKSVYTGHYVGVQSGTSPNLVANRTSIGTSEKFYQVRIADAGRSLRAWANSRYVTAESAGTQPLAAKRTTVGGWERFAVVDLGNGQVALFAHANKQFVTADRAGALPLIAKRSAVGLWERFTLVRGSDGAVSFRSAANGRYVTAEDAGAEPLIASRTTIGTWEKFTLG